MSYSKKFVEAFTFAERAHRDQLRKGTDVPYITHPMAVASIVAEYGGDEEQVIAALLHDVVEDTPTTVAEVSDRFGERVARIVADLSDTEQHQNKPDWRSRKEKYLVHLERSKPDSLLVSLADKLHNVGSILRDVRIEGQSVWGRFNASPAELAWYYGSLADVFVRIFPGPLTKIFVRKSSELVILTENLDNL